MISFINFGTYQYKTVILRSIKSLDEIPVHHMPALMQPVQGF